MRIAVYAIAKDEERFVERWAKSAADADHLVILDTGSSDNTAAVADGLGVITGVKAYSPWRFDKARNDSLALVPDDVDLCVALDLDEVLVPGWRAHLEAAYADGVNRPRYQYTWSWVGSKPDLVYGGDKIHSRHDFYWRHPVHEVLAAKPGTEERQGWYGLEIHHHPDSKKSRSSYGPLLELAVAEDPEDDRNSHYLAREFFFQREFEKSESEFRRHLSLDRAVWKPERAASMRYLYKITSDVSWLHAAIQECPDRREGYVDLAWAMYREARWEEAFKAARKALDITEKPLEYLCEPEAWGAGPHDVAAIAAYNLGYFHEARFHGNEALKLDPYDPRLARNLLDYREKAL